MKKQLIWLPVVLAVVMLAAWSKPLKEMMTSEKTVSKNISFAVYKADNYSSSAYADASAKLKITIVKARGTKRSIVWQKEFDAKALNQYPSLEKAVAQKVIVNNVVDSKDKLYVVYTLTYNDKGSEMQLRDGAVIAKGEKSGKLLINI